MRFALYRHRRIQRTSQSSQTSQESNRARENRKIRFFLALFILGGFLILFRLRATAGRSKIDDMADDRVIIFDTTLRDGEQAPGASLKQNEKLEVALALQDLGVDVIEAGFPVASKGEFEAVKTIAQSVKGPMA